MQITMLCMGVTDEKEIIALMQKYEKRLPAHYNFSRLELADIKNRKSLSVAQQKTAETQVFLQKIEKGDFVVLLDEKGKSMTSVGFSDFINRHLVSMTRHLVFVVGGPYGFSKEMYTRANAKISLSAMTFTHQMVRLFFVEQIYRGFTILQGKKYHHE